MKRLIAPPALFVIALVLITRPSYSQQYFPLDAPILAAPIPSETSTVAESMPTPADRSARPGGATQFESGADPIPSLAAPTAPPTAPNGADQQVEYLTRGPVHEAFVTQVPSDATASPVVPAAPPEAINEIPPEFRPEGDNVIWISGYWAWDEDRSDYLWVSGVWRTSPENRRWVPGYWTPVSDARDAVVGHQWVSGFWAESQVESVEYLSPPPASLEQGPSTPPVSDDHFWVPGSWVNQSHRYAWRPGHWHVHQQERIWVPSHYVWTPTGCVYVSGYWDYRIPERGQLFAPVYVERHIAARPDFYYQPQYLVNTPSLFMHLFVNPSRHHYYFGDYYEPHCRDHYHSYADYHRHGHGYDPLYVYYSNHFRRQGVNYGSRLSSWNLHFRINLNSRPSRTLHSHHRHLAGLGSHAASHDVLVRSLHAAAHSDHSHGSRSSIVRADASRRRAAAANAAQLASIRKERSRLEKHASRRHGRSHGKHSRSEVASLRLPKPSSVAIHDGKDHSHSHLYDERKPHPKVERGQKSALTPRTLASQLNRTSVQHRGHSKGDHAKNAPKHDHDTVHRSIERRPKAAPPARTLASQSNHDKTRSPKHAKTDSLVIRGSNEKLSNEKHSDRLNRIRNELRRSFSTPGSKTKSSVQIDRASKRNSTPTHLKQPKPGRPRTAQPKVEQPKPRSIARSKPTPVPVKRVQTLRSKPVPARKPAPKTQFKSPTRQTPPKTQSRVAQPRVTQPLAKTRSNTVNVAPRPTRPQPKPASAPRYNRATPKAPQTRAPQTRASKTRTPQAKAPSRAPTRNTKPAPPKPTTRSAPTKPQWGTSTPRYNRSATQRRTPPPKAPSRAKPTPTRIKPAPPQRAPRSAPTIQRTPRPAPRASRPAPKPKPASKRPTPPKNTRKKKGR